VSIGAALLINGPCGVGKSALAWAVSDILSEAGRRNAVIEFDHLAPLRPRGPDDPWGYGLSLDCLSLMLPRLARAGAEALIFPYVFETATDIDRLAATLPGAAITHCRLTAGGATLHDRLARRESGESLDWHRARADVLAETLKSGPAPDLVLDTDGATPEMLARNLLNETGWPDTGSDAT